MRAALIADLVGRVRSALGGAPSPRPPALEPWQKRLAADGDLAVRVESGDADGSCRVTVAMPLRPDGLAVAAGVLALHRMDVRSATIQSTGGAAVQVWHAVAGFRGCPTEATLRADITRALAGQLDLTAALANRGHEQRLRVAGPAEPRVEVLGGASADATVLDVRAHDEPGLLHRLVAAIGSSDAIVRSAVVGTLGAEAVDVFYLVGAAGDPLSDEALERVVGAVSGALVRVL
jgi:[protein-PII] uridylyltransferase